MIGWLVANVFSIIWRVAITLACILTLENLIQRGGYRVEFNTLLIAAIFIVIQIKIWSPSKNEVNKNE